MNNPNNLNEIKSNTKMTDTEILNSILEALEINADVCWGMAETSPEQEFVDLASFIKEKRKEQL